MDLLNFPTNDTHFFGRERGTAEHPLIPSKMENYIFDMDVDEPENTTRISATISFARYHNIMLYGDTGGGKTEHIKWMCSELRLPLYQVQGHKDMTFADLTGDWRPNTDPNNKAPFVFSDGPLALAVQNGGCFSIDEAASIPQGVLNALNDVANDRTRPLTIESDRGHRVVARHPEFQIALTLNPWDNYSGNQELNIAFCNRFHIFEWPYLSQKQELTLLKARFEIPKAVLNDVVAFASEIRSIKSANRESRYVLSHRDAINICEHVAMGWSPLQSVQQVVYPLVLLAAADEMPAIAEMTNNRFDK